MLRICAISVVIHFVASLPCSAQVMLVLKHTPGTVLVTETESKTQQILTLAGMDIETKSNTFLISSQTIGQRADDGSLPVVEKVTVLQSEIGLPGGLNIQFDSANPDKKASIPQLEPIMERLRITFKYPVTTILDDKGNIKEIKFPDGVTGTVDDANKSLVDPERRKKAAEQGRQFLPDEAVKPGDTWERSLDVDLGGGQVMAFRVKYKYDGTTDRDGRTFDKITAKAFEVSYSVDQTNATLKVSKSDLKIVESDETILFDREQGAVWQKTSKVRIQGPLTLVINGVELEGKVDLTIEGKSTRQK